MRRSVGDWVTEWLAADSTPEAACADLLSRVFFWAAIQHDMIELILD